MSPSSPSKSRLPIILIGALLAFCLAVVPAFAGAAIDHAAVSAWAETWSTGADVLDDFMAEDVRFKGPFFAFEGRNHYRDIVDLAQRQYSDIDFRPDELLMDGDCGALSWTISEVHKATGNAVKIKGVSILDFEDGKITAEWRVFDAAELARQLGGSVTYPSSDGGGDGDGGEDAAGSAASD